MGGSSEVQIRSHGSDATQARPVRDLRSLRSDEMLEACVTYAENPIVVTDLEGRVIKASQSASSLGVTSVARVGALWDEEALAPLLERAETPEAILRHIATTMYDSEARAKLDCNLVRPQGCIHLLSWPIRTAEGEHFGRIWSFRDVTREDRIRRSNELLYALSAFHDAKPSGVLAFAAEAIARHFDATCLVSSRRGDFLQFRAVGGEGASLFSMVGASLPQTFESLAVESAIAIADVRADPRTRGMLPARLGFRSFLSVPILNADAERAGFVTVLSRLPDHSFEQDDHRLLTLVALRLSIEFDRDEERKRSVASAAFEAEKDLDSTRDVLDAMSRSTGLVAREESEESLLVMEAATLQNLIGFGSAAIVWRKRDGREVIATPFDHRIPSETSIIGGLPREGAWLGKEAIKRLGLQSFEEVYSMPIEAEGARRGALLFASDSMRSLTPFREGHISALATHIAASIVGHERIADLYRTISEMRTATDASVQAEKLAGIGALANVVAHDIKNVLAAATMELSIPSEPVRLIESVRNHLDRFSVLSHRLLAYARPRLLVKSRVDVYEVLTSLATLLASQLRISDVQLVLDPPKSSAIATGDRAQIEHLFVALFHNAIQAMSAARGGTLEVIVNRSGSRVLVVFRDDGPGIEPDILPHVFEPFFSTRHEGMGLGLYSARRIAQEHDGDVSVNSAVGEGTTVTVSLPTAADL